MGLIGRIAQTIVNKGLREIQLEAYKNYPKWMRDVAPAGIDVCPLPDDQGVGIVIETQGKGAFLGVYPDPQAQPGEARLYSRNSDGAQQAVLWLKADGKIDLNGNSKKFVTHAELNTALQTFISALNAQLAAIMAVNTAASSGTGFWPATPGLTLGSLSLDISAAETQTVRTDG